MAKTFKLEAYYPSLFLDALRSRYNNRDFTEGFARIKAHYIEIQNGRPLEITDVMELFKEDLPFHDAWTKPDPEDLGKRMHKGTVAKGLQKGIQVLARNPDDLDAIESIWRCFRELGLTSLVLHHIYPRQFAMCSHHLASRLHISEETVPRYYREYCNELRAWRKEY